MRVIINLWEKWDKLLIKAERFGLGILLVLGFGLLLFSPVVLIPFGSVKIIAAVFLCPVLFSRMVYAISKTTK